MARPSLDRLANSPTTLAVLSVLLIIGLFMLNAAIQNSRLFGNIFTPLLLVIGLGVLSLLGLIAYNVIRLWAQYRAGVMGSRLTLRLLGMIMVLAVIPVITVFAVSIQTINRGIDSWFDVSVEKALDDALLLGRIALDTQKQELLVKTRTIAGHLEQTSDRLAVSALNLLREQHDISELTLFAPDGKILAYAGQESGNLVPPRPEEAVLSQIRQGLSYASLDAISSSDLRMRAVVPVYPEGGGVPRILQALQPLPNRYTNLGENVQSAYVEYEKLVYLRGPLKFSFTLSLSLVALITILISVWASIFSTRRVLAPVRDLAEGTAAVASGNYRKRLPVASQDELGLLINSFNDMTDRIRRAQLQTRRSQREAETQRTYLEAVLGHLSSGVVSTDKQGHLRTTNATAGQLLGIDLEPFVGRALDAIASEHPALAHWAQAIGEALGAGNDEWQTETVVTTDTMRRTLILRGSRLSTTSGGYVIVFDDVTALIQAQRDAAWSEVARRLAHEIKNPLTPIQLSAERVRYKCLDHLENEARETLDRSTRTIVDQVESLKEMINAFSSYARPVQIHLQTVDLNDLIRDVIELHRGDHQQHPADLQLQLDEGLPPVRADSGRLRQVLHNLLLNARDATRDTREARITITTALSSGGDSVTITVNDNGPGIPQDMMDTLFEPYTTSKEKGSGLGLAIVKKIVEEHHGTLSAGNNANGASIRIGLPVASRDERSDNDTPRERQA